MASLEETLVEMQTLFNDWAVVLQEVACSERRYCSLLLARHTLLHIFPLQFCSAFCYEKKNVINLQFCFSELCMFNLI